MHLRKAHNKKIGRTYLSIVHSYRDKITKKPKAKKIESLGYLNVLEKEYNDPIAFFEEKVKKMNQQQESEKVAITLRLKREERVGKDTANRKNFGYAVLSDLS